MYICIPSLETVSIEFISKGMATRSPQRQQREGLDGGDVLTPSCHPIPARCQNIPARCQNIPAIQALPPLALGGAGGHALKLFKCNLHFVVNGVLDAGFVYIYPAHVGQDRRIAYNTPLIHPTRKLDPHI